MKNWLGQDIQKGDVVYRGARDGDSSSFRIGIVDLVREEKGSARVEWRWVGSSTGIYDRRQYTRHYDDPNAYSVPGPYAYSGGKGTSDINTLVKMGPEMLEYLNKRAASIDAARDKGISEDDFEDFSKDFIAGKIPF